MRMKPKQRTKVINNELITFKWGLKHNAFLGWVEVSRKPVHPEYKNKFPRMRIQRERARWVMKNRARLARGGA